MENLIGKKYELLNVDNSVMESFIIRHVEEKFIPYEDEEGQKQAIRQLKVSKDGVSWFTVYGGLTDRIV